MPLIGSTHSSFYSGLRINEETKPPLEIVPGMPLPDFPNGDFEQDFKYWDVFKQHTSPGSIVNPPPPGTKPGLLTSVLGCPIPPDPTPYPIGNANINSPLPLGPFTSPGQDLDYQYDSFNRKFEAEIGYSGDGKYAILRSGKGIFTTVPGTTVYGPTLVSQNPVIAEEGDKVVFRWKATANGDAYNVFAYLLNKETCQHIVLIDATGENERSETPWFNAERVIGPGEAANYYFVFICGSFDYTAGYATGSELYVDEVNLYKAGTY